ncbi:DUF3309 family protein [Legionella pneumophila]|uniref:DUF3309 family protein n=1 Tax=Legionella pneumophila TaxID=446 RepID=UPI003C6D03E4
MSILNIVVIIVLIILIGLLPTFGLTKRYKYYLPIGLMVIFVVIAILFAFGVLKLV